MTLGSPFKPTEKLDRAMTKRIDLLLTLVLAGSSLSGLESDNPHSPSHGIAYPDGWKEWATIAVSHRNDNNTMRLIVGNDIAVEAARSGSTNP